eukprot:Anaeramoba_flamelloidesc39907_g1_i1.p1 GENE.c39907_g1_i1~~c39907_g1_i1.p1  ORF type:complete len:374 (+),score=80.80 c39907_g1_i1:2-1123(+)
MDLDFQLTAKNKTPAAIQITAEQILAEAINYQDKKPIAPRHKIEDEQELKMYQERKRRQFETAIKGTKGTMGSWMHYATWEARQFEFARARSVFERALEIDYTHAPTWIKYLEMELKLKKMNFARNLFDRVVTYLPRWDVFWYKYIHLEEALNNIEGVRLICKRWMEWEPNEAAWLTYAKFETRHKEIELARDVYEAFIRCHPKVDSYLRYAKWELKNNHEISKARNVYERTLKELEEDAYVQVYFCTFAQFEEKQGEFERARVLYKYALDNLPRSEANHLYRLFIGFEKKHGTKETIEEVIISKRRFYYEELSKSDPQDYDIWFDRIKLEEENGKKEAVREIYERAIGNIPLINEKKILEEIYLFMDQLRII